MKWQEYQEAAARMYEQADGIGNIHRNVFLPDRVTGQPRQIDVLLEVQAKWHTIRILIDAKFRRRRIDVKDVEGVLGLAQAVGADRSVIVAANGWTQPAKAKADFYSAELVLLDIDEALELVVENKWQLCPSCNVDCIIMNHEGSILIEDELGAGISVYLAGQCRQCGLAFLWCWACGEEGYLEPGESYVCWCGHAWSSEPPSMTVCPVGQTARYAI
jgi:hypothetical protein